MRAEISFNILFIHVNGTINYFTTELAVPAVNAAEVALQFSPIPSSKINVQNFVLAFLHYLKSTVYEGTQRVSNKMPAKRIRLRMR